MNWWTSLPCQPLHFAPLAPPFPVQTLQSSTWLHLSLSVCLYVFSHSKELCLSKVSGGPVCLSGQSMACRRQKHAQLCSGRSAEWRTAPTASPVGGRRQGRECVCVFKMGGWGYLWEVGEYLLLTLHIINTIQRYYSEMCVRVLCSYQRWQRIKELVCDKEEWCLIQGQ